ncbi:hypothetical protein SprV_0200638800 [Sparganum proliferum]
MRTISSSKRRRLCCVQLVVRRRHSHGGNASPLQVADLKSKVPIGSLYRRDVCRPVKPSGVVGGFSVTEGTRNGTRSALLYRPHYQ